MIITRRSVIAAFATCFLVGVSDAQTSQPTGAESVLTLKHRPISAPTQTADSTIDLTVPKGSALVVRLEYEIRIKGVGQPVHGLVIEPVYAFDRLLIPVGTKVDGKISAIGQISSSKRTLAALDANLTPDRNITMEFTDLVFPDGKRLAIKTSTARGSGHVLEFVASAGSNKKPGIKATVKQKEQEAKGQVRDALGQVRKPNRIRRLEKLTLAQLPIHPQYLDAGTVYFAELERPLEFGSESITPQMAATINTAIPARCVIRASLSTSLSSATTPKGTDVEAVLSQPLLSNNSLIIPQGSVLKGSVVQVQPAGFWKHNGQLRFVFRDLILPNGLESRVDGVLQGVQANSAERLKVDSEGGAAPQTPNSRYIRAAVSVGLAAATHEDEVVNRAEGGAGGFKVIGIVVGAASGSQPLAIAMGALGASRSIYDNFISRGRDVEFAKHTIMQVELDTHEGISGPATHE